MSCCARCLFFPQFVHSQKQYLRSEVGFLVSCRKDTYGVFSDPVDPEEVCVLEDDDAICLVFLLLILEADRFTC